MKHLTPGSCKNKTKMPVNNIASGGKELYYFHQNNRTGGQRRNLPHKYARPALASRFPSQQRPFPWQKKLLASR